MKLSFITPLVAALLAAGPVAAAPFTIDFESVTGFDPVGNQYSALGVNFGGDALGVVNDAAGPYFSNAPSPVGVMTPVGPDATMNADEGFGFFSFWYSSAERIADAVQVWSELDGQGTLLASFNLAANAQLGCDDTAYCHWDRLSASWSGLARSVTFGNAVGVGFDNLSTVPEPTSAALAALALAGLATRRRRR